MKFIQHTTFFQSVIQPIKLIKMKRLTLILALIAFAHLPFISCVEEDPLSSEKQITKFTINKIEGTINEQDKSIQLEVFADAEVNKLSPIIEISPKASVNPASGIATDFTNPVIYTVTAEDNSSVKYTVTVSVSTEIKEIEMYSFTYNSKNYVVCKEKMTWTNAAAFAVEQGGYLAEINSADENKAIFNEALNNASLNLTQTTALDGGGAAYVWIGGNDLESEGKWFWDGDNKGDKTQFWQGTASGNAVGGLYTNWGNEPDDYNGQDCLALALTEWPLNAGTLGNAGQWNDLRVSDKLYFVIEHN